MQIHNGSKSGTLNMSPSCVHTHQVALLVLRFAMCEDTPHLDYRHTIANCNLTTMVTNKVFNFNVLDYFPCLPPHLLRIDTVHRQSEDFDR